MLRVTRSDASVPNPTSWSVGFAAEWTADDTPAAVFVMQASGGSLTTASFSCVASEIQMRDLPEGEPDESGPFFRVADFTVIFRTESAVLEFQQSLLDAVQQLVDERQAAEDLAVTSEFEITPSLP